MKRTVAILLVLATVVGLFAGCGRDEDPTGLKNGTYRVTWDSPDEQGYTEYVVLGIQGGVISVSEYDAVDATGQKKSEDRSLTGQPQRAYDRIVANYVLAQGDLDRMEGVAGATISTGSFKTLVGELLQANALTGDKEDLVLPWYEDGDYRAETAAFDVYGYKDYVELSIVDGVVTLKAFDAVGRDGKAKTADTELEPVVEFSKVYSDLRAAYFNNSGDLDAVEIVSGATTTSMLFKALVSAALDSAHHRGGNTSMLHIYTDGTYSAEMRDFENGWKGFVTLKVENGVVTILEYGSKNEAGELKKDNAALRQGMVEANAQNGLPETYPELYEKAIVDEFRAVGGDLLKMDNIAGATVSTNNFKLMAGELLGYNATYGFSETLIVAPIGDSGESVLAEGTGDGE